MRRLLGSPIVVAALVIVAFIAVSQNIIAPISQGRHLRAPAMMPAVKDKPLIAVSPSSRSDVEWDLVGWPERINRDPFRSESAFRNSTR